MVSDNQVYALTKGQSSPTTDFGVKNALSPEGTRSIPLNPLALAITMGAPFVARGFADDKEHLSHLIREAILFKGTALVDILQPCVSFNKINTYAWYRERVFRLEKPLTDRYEALKTAELWEEKIPIGVIYRNDGTVCQEIKPLFREPVTKEHVAAQLGMSCVMMR